MSRKLGAALLVLVLTGSMTAASAEEPAPSLDEQVQEIKSDVLRISTELEQLEEKLLYPSTTQLAVFVDLADGETFRLDSVRIVINGHLAAHHIYSFKELEALQGGGVQRIYTGNVPTGVHDIEVSVAGKLPSGKDYSDTRSFSFDKGIEPKMLGITLAGRGPGDSGIELGDW